MRNISKKLLSFGLASVMVCLCAVTWSVMPRPADAAADYYAPITATEGTALLGQVHDLITTTHKKYTSYDDCKNPTYVKKTDPGTGGALMEFYAHADLSSSWEGGNVGTWNREHVWCQSLSGPSKSETLWGTSGGGADLHHIRPTESRVNSARGNNKYADFSGGNTVWYKDKSNTQIAIAGYTSGGKFMPKDEVKGDVARIVMYVYTHYNTYRNVGGTTNGSGNGNYFGTLNFTYVVSASSESAAQELLLKWNESDPVDDIERTRNEAVYEIQGNRNPFVDHPEYAEAIWGDGTTTPPKPDTELKSLSLTPSSVSLTVGESVTLSVSATPAEASKAVTWSTTDASVATVSDGTVKARNAGTATITATSVNSPSVKATAEVHVTASQGGGGGGETGSLTISIASFSLNAGYGFQTWSEGGAEGIAYIYGDNTNSMQFNKSKDSYYLASTTALPGAIKSVTVSSSSTEGTYGGDRPWKLLTSASPYGEVAGKPTEGTDQGTKTVTSNGTKWEVSGSDTFFALTYELEDTKGAAYLDSIVIEYGEGGGGHVHSYEYQEKDDAFHVLVCTECGDVKEEEAHVYSDDSDATCDVCGHKRTVGGQGVEAFKAAVSALVTEGPLQERLPSLNRAITAYNALSEEERAAAAGETEALRAAIEAYNAIAAGYNRDAQSANDAAVRGAGSLF